MYFLPSFNVFTQIFSMFVSTHSSSFIYLNCFVVFNSSLFTNPSSQEGPDSRSILNGVQQFFLGLKSQCAPLTLQVFTSPPTIGVCIYPNTPGGFTQIPQVDLLLTTAQILFPRCIIHLRCMH